MFTSDFAQSLHGPDWLRALRSKAFDLFDGAQMPSAAEETWRYGLIDDLSLDAFSPVETTTPHGALAGSTSDFLAAVGDRSALLATVDGELVESSVDESMSAKGLRCEGAGSVEGGELVESLARLDEYSDRYFALMNAAFTRSPLIIDVPAGVVIDKPIVIVHRITSGGTAVFPSTFVRIGENAEASVIELLVSDDDDAALVVPVTRLEVGPAARGRYLNVQFLNERSWQLGHQSAHVDRDGYFAGLSVAFGGHYARVETENRLTGVGASSDLKALYFATGDQVHDFRTLQAHDAPRTASDLFFKGAVGDVANSVYSGLIRIVKGASGSTAFQTNRNLVLTEGAQAHSVPNLEIEENDVKCSHASAVGPIDEEQLYYLESRGVPTDIAERLIVQGFLDEMLESTRSREVQTFLRSKIADKLARLGSTGGVQ